MLNLIIDYLPQSYLINALVLGACVLISYLIITDDRFSFNRKFIFFFLLIVRQHLDKLELKQKYLLTTPLIYLLSEKDKIKEQTYNNDFTILNGINWFLYKYKNQTTIKNAFNPSTQEYEDVKNFKPITQTGIDIIHKDYSVPDWAYYAFNQDRANKTDFNDI